MQENALIDRPIQFLLELHQQLPKDPQLAKHAQQACEGVLTGLLDFLENASKLCRKRAMLVIAAILEGLAAHLSKDTAEKVLEALSARLNDKIVENRKLAVSTLRYLSHRVSGWVVEGNGILEGRKRPQIWSTVTLLLLDTGMCLWWCVRGRRGVSVCVLG